MRKLYLVLLVIAACGDDAAVTLQEVMIVPDLPTTKLDVLFVVDNGPSTLDNTIRVEKQFQTFLDGLPANVDLHLGVVTTDMGTSALASAPGPAIPGSVGGCADTGQDGRLQTFGTQLVTGNYIATNPPNYTGELVDAFRAIISVGAAGCGFQQPLSAMANAIAADGPVENAGFVRSDANLAVVMLVAEDDCSVEDAQLFTKDTSQLGPLQSFRCTQYGVTCDVGGATPDEMAVPGMKQGCHASADGSLVAPIDVFVDEVKQLKPDPAQIMIALIAGAPTPFATELRAPSGSSSAIPALAHSCSYTDTSNSPEVADPAVRLVEFANQFPLRNILTSVCDTDLVQPLVDIAALVTTTMGDTCIPEPITDQCTVIDAGTTLPQCHGTTTDCWELVTDATCTRLTIHHTPVANGFTHVSCPIP
ncbi:MAG: hypothetical protein QM831_18315 [Kofleriaceae bacterium]